MKSIKQNWISWLVGLALAFAILSGLQYATRGHFADPDGFYHARSSQIITEQNQSETESAKATLEDGRFPWLYFTTWNKGYANQHYLYHWLLAPFNTVEKLPISIVFFGLLFVTLFVAALVKYKISFVPFWILLLLAGSVDFLFRINLVKANTISLVMLFAIVFLMHLWHAQKSKLALIGIGFISAIFVWTYGGFVCVPMLLGAYAVSEIITQRNFKLTTFTKAFFPVLISAIGIVIGMTLHPQNHNLSALLYDQLFRTGLGAGSVVPAGNEWLAFNINWFFKSNILVLFTWLFSIGIFVRALYIDWKNSSQHTLTFWVQITALGLMALTLWHRRFVEYWIPFAVIATAITLQPYVEKLSWSEVKSTLKFWQMKVGVAMIAVFILGVSAYNVDQVYLSLKAGDSGTSYKEAAIWLEQNSEAGDIVLNTQ